MKANNTGTRATNLINTLDGGLYLKLAEIPAHSCVYAVAVGHGMRTGPGKALVASTPPRTCSRGAADLAVGRRGGHALRRDVQRATRRRVGSNAG